MAMGVDLHCYFLHCILQNGDFNTIFSIALFKNGDFNNIFSKNQKVRKLTFIFNGKVEV